MDFEFGNFLKEVGTVQDSNPGRLGERKGVNFQIEFEFEIFK